MLSFHHCSLLHHLAVIYITAIILCLLIYAATNPVAGAAAVSQNSVSSWRRCTTWAHGSSGGWDSDTVGTSWRAHCAATLWSCSFPSQGSHASWKVLDFFLENSRTWKVLENQFGPGKSWKLKLTVLESPGKISLKVMHFSSGSNGNFLQWTTLWIL